MQLRVRRATANRRLRAHHATSTRSAGAGTPAGASAPPGRALSALAALVATVILPGVGLGAPSCLDPRFGIDGSVKTDFRLETYPEARGLVIQGDGKIVAAGTLSGIGGVTLEFALTRHDPDGALDPGFGSGGRVTTSFGASSLDEGNAVAIQGDGKIVVVGSSFDLVSSLGFFAVARYGAGGTLDPTFGAGGMVTTSFGTDFASAAAVAIQEDGRIVVAGRTDRDFALARYDASGTLDPTFGSGGKVTTDFAFGAGSAARATGVAIQEDGKIVVAGSAGPAGASGFAVARYDVSGILDPTFGVGGTLTTIDAATGAAAAAVAIQADGKIVVAGDNRPFSGFAVVRYDASGSLDPTFGSGGEVTTDLSAPGSAEGDALVIQPDGKIVVAGSGFFSKVVDGVPYEVPSFAVARYAANGALDPAFGGRGLSTAIDFGSALAVTLRDDGKIIAAGSGFRLARYDETACAQEITGSRLLIKDSADATKRKLIFVSKDPMIDTGPGSDVAPVSNGASVHVYNDRGTADSTCLSMPAAAWQVTGTPPEVGYRYRDGDFAHGPCKVATIRGGRLLQVECVAKTQPLDYSLDEPTQGRVAVRFTSGPASYCAVFGGAIRTDSGTSPPITGGKGRFNAKDAPRPQACPIPPAGCPAGP